MHTDCILTLGGACDHVPGSEGQERNRSAKLRERASATQVFSKVVASTLGVGSFLWCGSVLGTTGHFTVLDSSNNICNVPLLVTGKPKLPPLMTQEERK
jgi:hypothetical protein